MMRFQMIMRAFAFCLMWLVLAAGSALADISDVRVVGNGEPTRITIWSDRPQSHSVFLSRGNNGREIILALPGSESVARGEGMGGVPQWTLSKGQLKFHLDRPMMVARVLDLPPAGSAQSHRIIVDLQTVSEARFSSVARRDMKQLARLSGAARVDVAEARDTTSSKNAKRPRDAGRYRIVIDPGHGGKDPGATAVTGVHERAIVLKAALTLKAMLEKERRYEVKLTREDNRFVELEDRVGIARDFGADLFISLHADAAANSSVSGASVYTISSNGEKRIDREASKNDWRMPIEDGTSLEVGGILEDLIKRETKTRSAEFAEALLPELALAGPVLRDTHKNAGFYVLLAPDVPAVLLEMGFLTNKADAKRLASARGRKKSMQAVKRGIDTYFDQQDRLVAQHTPNG